MIDMKGMIFMINMRKMQSLIFMINMRKIGGVVVGGGVR